MFWPKNLLPDPERFLVERLGFGVLARCFVQHGKVIEGSGCLGVFRTPTRFSASTHSFRNGNRLLIFSLFKQFV